MSKINESPKMTIRLPPKLLARLKEIARQKKVTLSELAKEILRRAAEGGEDASRPIVGVYPVAMPAGVLPDEERYILVRELYRRMHPFKPTVTEVMEALTFPSMEEVIQISREEYINEETGSKGVKTKYTGFDPYFAQCHVARMIMEEVERKAGIKG